ncbi:MAG: Uncharacterized protein Greene041662_273 [Candidatus Peregrinibacteria bacterium Greene0416_62]|nr:MAG: Uncharacterized protein Greene041662_273 [Candidatus Peregrinibacteria bacterium Greene0416_62]TSC98981.1 MAG: Uncharacterized protein Greene101449_764 [Candidatus Peregrinibacteria bacterium Greene1014_49]
MTVVITHSIQRKEFKHGKIPPDVLETIISAYAKGISVPIKGESLPKGSRLVKLYVTTIEGARRLVFLVDVETGTGFFLFYRGKNDPIGKNISIKNPAFRNRLLQYLDLLLSDISAEEYTTYGT